MKRTSSQPIILSFPTSQDPQVIPMASGSRRTPRHNRVRRRPTAPIAEVPGADWNQMRTRLLRMILENERVRTDGPRAS